MKAGKGGENGDICNNINNKIKEKSKGTKIVLKDCISVCLCVHIINVKCTFYSGWGQKV